MFFIDKYIPKTIDDVYFNKDIYNLLELMSKDSSIPHTIFYGSEGSGKHIMVNMFLKMLYGEDVEHTKSVTYNVSESGNNSSDETFLQSHYHIIVCPKGNNHDRYLIQDVVKVFAGSTTMFMFNGKHSFKVVVIDGIDKMTFQVQFSLRRTIEKYSDKCRFILISNSLGKIIKPLISRSMCIQIKSPTEQDIVGYSLQIAKKEKINLSLSQLSWIINSCENNIKKILWILQIYQINQSNLIMINTTITKIKNVLHNLKLDYSSELDKMFDFIKDIIHFNEFEYRNCNKTRNYIAKLFDPIILKIFTSHVKYNEFKTYFSKTKIFLNAFKDTNLKKIEFKTDSTLFNAETCILEFRLHLSNLMILFGLLDIKTDKEKNIIILTDLITKANPDTIDEIRDIIFNLMITNITGTEIVKLYLNSILNYKNISPLQKIKIMDLCRQTEYGIIKGRRSINQFDRMILESMNIILNCKDKKK